MQLSPSTKNIYTGWASIATTVLGTAAFIHLSGGIGPCFLSYFSEFRIVEHLYLARGALVRVWAQYWPTHYLSSTGSAHILEGQSVFIQYCENSNNPIRTMSFDLNKIKKELVEEVGLSPEKISIHFSRGVSCNASAIGSRNAGGIEVTQGCLEQLALQSGHDQALAESKLKAILVHEMGHLKHNDTLFLHGILSINELCSVLIGHVLGFGLIKKFIMNVFMTKCINIFSRSREHYADEMILEYAPEHKEKLFEGMQIVETGNKNIIKNTLEKLEATLPRPVIWLFNGLNDTEVAFQKFSATHPETEARKEHLHTLQKFNNKSA
jgi:Zn-dependent protease with chaperone function